MIKNKGRKTYHLFKYKHNLKPKKVKIVQDPLKNMKLTLKFHSKTDIFIDIISLKITSILSFEKQDSKYFYLKKIKQTDVEPVYKDIFCYF